MSDQKHYLLTALGTRLAPVTYQLGSQQVEARAAPLALLQLLDDANRPNHVVVVITPEVKQQTWDAFRTEFDRCLSGRNVVLDAPVEVPQGRTSAEIREVLQKVAERFQAPCKLTIDVTHGFRHFPFIVYPLALYLSSLRDVSIAGAYYGMAGPPEQGHVWPIISLDPLLRLPEWFHAVRVFRDYGATDRISTRLRELFEQMREAFQQQGESHRIRDEAAPLATAADRIGYFGSFYGLGLPLELGRAVRGVEISADQIRQALATRVPLGEELFELIDSALRDFAFDQKRVSSFKGLWKPRVPLDREELERQARLVEQYFERRQFALGLSLLREWVISWVIWRQGEAARWLEREVRQRAARYLGAAAQLAQGKATIDSPISADLHALGEFWNRLTELRNRVAHNGMGPEEVEIDDDAVRSVEEVWKKRFRVGEFELPLIGGGGGTLLVTPQGQRKGVLFSAIKAAQKIGHDVSRCVVVCSEQSRDTLQEAADAAGFSGDLIPVTLQDAFAGFGELPELVAQTESAILSADEVVANLTGGTTLMGIVVQKLVEQAQALARPTLRFALVDRRPVAEQSANPFVESEYYLIDELSRATD